MNSYKMPQNKQFWFKVKVLILHIFTIYRREETSHL